MKVIPSERRINSIIQDIESLRKINKSSLEIGVSMTTSMMKIIIEKMKTENPTLNDQEILERVRKFIYLR
jgi:hypothetical protein